MRTLTRTTEVHHSTEARTQTITREPVPGYNANGEEAAPHPPPRDLELAGPEPTPVTARSARRYRLWESGILVLAQEGGSLVIGPIDEGLTTESVHSNPRREPEEIRLQPENEVVFVPSGPEETGAEFPPVRVHRRRRVIRVRPDTADRYSGLYKLLTAAECIPNPVGEDLGRLTWGLVYDSIPVAKRAERIMRTAGHFAGSGSKSNSRLPNKPRPYC